MFPISPNRLFAMPCLRGKAMGRRAIIRRSDGHSVGEPVTHITRLVRGRLSPMAEDKSNWFVL